MSKKNRARRGAPSSKGPAAQGPGRPDVGIERILASLFSAIKAGDRLKAELETAYSMAIPLVAGIEDPEEIETFISSALIEAAVRKPAPDGAALLRLLMALGSTETRRAASKALAELTGSGVYPPEWVTEIGKATPGQAWRRYDIFGDNEAVAVTFSYGEDEHVLLVQVDQTGLPVATAIGMSSEPARVIEAINRDDEEFDGHEPISLAEARRRLLRPLDRAEHAPGTELPVDSAAYLPIARSRVRRIPEGEPGPVFTAADRAAAVDEFMKSPQAAQAGDEDTTRFWAEVLTGYSGRAPGEPPDQVGPRKLAYILLGHVPNTFVLSAAQREHLEPAVTAWLRWSAEHRNLGEAATARLMEQVPRVLSRFAEAYDDPDAAEVRGYVSDLATSDADVAWLSRNVGRRMFAVPLAKGTRDVADPAARAGRVAEEFGDCTPPPGLTSEEFVAAAQRVVEEIWRDERGTFETAERLFTEGMSRHDIVHRLAGAPAETIGTSIIR